MLYLVFGAGAIVGIVIAVLVVNAELKRAVGRGLNW